MMIRVIYSAEELTVNIYFSPVSKRRKSFNKPLWWIKEMLHEIGCINFMRKPFITRLHCENKTDGFCANILAIISNLFTIRTAHNLAPEYRSQFTLYLYDLCIFIAV